MQTAFPTPEDDDAEDVAWGLTTGAALWKQGERYDAIVWLKRAVEAANEAGAAGRADQLNRAATDLIARLAVVPPHVAPVPPQLAPVSAPNIPASPPRAPTTAPRFPVTNPGFPAVSPAAPTSAPKTAAAPPAHPPPRPPMPSAPKPPPPKAPSPPPMRRAAPVPPKPPPPRAAMSSVATSAPTIDELTAHHAEESAASEAAREPPPPPTIEPVALPDLPSEPSTPNIPIDMVDERTPVMLAGLVELQAPPVASDAADPSPSGDDGLADSIEPEPQSSPALLAALDGLPLTADQKRTLCRMAVIETLSSEEDVSVPYLALVVEGKASAQATVADVNAVTVDAGEMLYAKSSIVDALSLRLVAESEPTIVALWDHRADEVLSEAPEWVEQLRRSSDRTQAIAGCSMGAFGERLDDVLRSQAIEQLDVRVLAPNEVIAAAGEPVPGMVIVGVGTVELDGDNGDGERLGPGDFLFATEVLGGGAAPTTARAGAKGAIVLFGPRAVAHELLLTCPPLLEVFAGM